MLTTRKVNCHLHSDIKLPIKFKITFVRSPADITDHKITCHLVLSKSFKETIVLDFQATKPNTQWVTFLCKYADLTKEAILVITLEGKNGEKSYFRGLFNNNLLLNTEKQENSAFGIITEAPPFKHPILFSGKGYEGRRPIIHKNHPIYKIYDPNAQAYTKPKGTIQKPVSLLEYIQKKELCITPPITNPYSVFVQFSQNMTLATFFYWHLLLKDIQLAKEFEAKAVPPSTATALHHQRLFLSAVANATRLSQTAPQMARVLEQSRELKQITESFPAPVRPDQTIKEMSFKCSIFNSARKPRLITFKTPDNKDCKMIYKLGDDLRQDQMIAQIITLMDSILKENGLDLCLVKYNILPTSESDGFVEFVPDCSTMKDILDKDKSIKAYLKKHNPGPGFMPYLTAVDTFVKSAAGYSLITYILGIGDRHQENMLITKSGHFFHIDFGFIFGLEPKGKEILSPVVRVTPEMVDVMGAKFDLAFKQYVDTAFCILRKHIDLILQLIPTEAHEFIKQRFHMAESEEEAGAFILHSISKAAESFLPKVIDMTHDIAMLIKKVVTDEKDVKLPDKMFIRFGK